jgi:CHAD domain
VSGVHLAIAAGRPLAAEVKRIAIVLADDALEQLREAAAGARDETVHEARKRFKELRALLRLIENAAGGRRTRRARLQLRDAGRSLSGARDADALGETLLKLHERFGGAFDRSREFTRRLIEEAQAGVLDADTASRLTAAVRNNVAIWSFEAAMEDVHDDLRKSFRAAQRAMRAALVERSPAAFHEWRKREKDCWYQARMTEEIVPAMHEGEPLLRRLARILGDHHDLVVLREIAAKHADEASGDAAVNVLSHALERMRELEQEAEVLGPEAFDKRRRWRLSVES